MSMDDLGRNRYGQEICRLLQAQLIARRGYETARKSYVSKPVLNDIKSLAEILQTNLTRAERDNDLIYHQDVPPFSSLPAITSTSLGDVVIPEGLLDPRKVVSDSEVLFGELVAWGAQTAISKQSVTFTPSRMYAELWLFRCLPPKIE